MAICDNMEYRNVWDPCDVGKKAQRRCFLNTVSWSGEEEFVGNVPWGFLLCAYQNPRLARILVLYCSRGPLVVRVMLGISPNIWLSSSRFARVWSRIARNQAWWDGKFSRFKVSSSSKSEDTELWKEEKEEPKGVELRGAFLRELVTRLKSDSPCVGSAPALCWWQRALLLLLLLLSE